MSTHDILFGEQAIAARVTALAKEIVAAPRAPEVMVGILVGAFVFVADLARALAREGLSLPVEFLWLRRYGNGREGGDVTALAATPELVRGKSVLLVDGVLDHGTTLAVAKRRLADTGARAIATAVALDKLRSNAKLHADYAAFSGVHDFVIGYGMDDAGLGRALPYIARAKLG